MKKSLSDSLIKNSVNNIFTKLDNYRKCCAFLLFIMGSIRPYMTADKGFLLDDLHAFIYYLLKFGYNKFSFLYKFLENKECPEKLLKHVETAYWNNFLESEQFVSLKLDTKKGMDMIEKIFMKFRVVELGPYLHRAGRDPKEFDTIYNDNVQADCTARFTGKLLEAIYVLQKMSQTKKDTMGYELSKIWMDLEFGQLMVDSMDNYEVEVDIEGYKYKRDRMSGNIKDFIHQRKWST